MMKSQKLRSLLVSWEDNNISDYEYCKKVGKILNWDYGLVRDIVKMNDKNTSLIIANMFIIGAFVVENVIEWLILCIFGVFWLINYFSDVRK